MTTYSMKPLGCDPRRIKDMSEKLIVSHYENNYGGAVKRLNFITEQLAGLDFSSTPGFLINGLKREQLIAVNSMILHELFFDGLGEESAPDAELIAAIVRDFGSYDRWRAEFIVMGRRRGRRLGLGDPNLFTISMPPLPEVMRVISKADMFMPAPASTYAHEITTTIDRAPRTTILSRLTALSTAESIHMSQAAVSASERLNLRSEEAYPKWDRPHPDELSRQVRP